MNTVNMSLDILRYLPIIIRSIKFDKYKFYLFAMNWNLFNCLKIFVKKRKSIYSFLSIKIYI